MTTKQPRQKKVYKAISFQTPTTFILRPSKTSQLPWLSVWYPCQAGFLPLLLLINVILIRRWNCFHMEAMWLKNIFPRKESVTLLYVSVAKEISLILLPIYSWVPLLFTTNVAFPKNKWQKFSVGCHSCNRYFDISLGELFQKLWFSEFSKNALKFSIICLRKHL
jgi:hypothetical protein